MTSVAPRVLSAILAVVAALIMTSVSSAHPHVLPTVKTNLIFSPEGLVMAIEHTWLYDSAYSTFVGRDIDTDKNGTVSNDELAAFAKNQIDALAEHSYFTTIKTPTGGIELGASKSYAVAKRDDGRLQLQYTVLLKTAAPVDQEQTDEQFDPAFFAYFTMVDDGVHLVGARQDCRPAVSGPQPIDLKNTKIIPSVFWQALDGSKSAGLQFVNRITVTCP
jgi:ABC-type uncharacterized transport system substrate-binding protein